MSVSCLAMVCLSLSLAASNDEVKPDANRGLYAIWIKEDAQVPPFIRGGQVHLQWADVEPQQGRYDFSVLDAQLRRLHEKKWPATVQINANRHPDWLFTKVPYQAERLSPQVSDRQGTLMYWHPAYLDAYLNMLAAYGQHLRQSPYRENVLGVRLNFNAVGTEHFEVPPAAHDPSQWTTPPGVEAGPAWSRQAVDDYKQRVIAAFAADFTPQVRVFVRNGMVDTVEADRRLAGSFETGRLALFHTSSEIEPRSKGVERQYLAFLKYARPGKTLAYAEPWADAWGRHGGMTDPRWTSPSQWNYWRLLVDLHCGVSFIAIYGADLAHAEEPEFRAAFEFAARYAGYHASPTQSPGAWVAMREGDFLKGDYTFLMRRLDGDSSRPVKKAGPDDQRYGAWARIIPAGGRARFALDERFAASLRGQKAAVRVVYLDAGQGPFKIGAGGYSLAVTPANSGRWRTVEMDLDGSALAPDSSGAQVTLLPQDDLTVHMVEVVRKGFTNSAR